MNVFLLLLITTSTLVLRSGDRITVEGAMREDNGVITFRSNGQLYSMPLLEVVRIEDAPQVAEQKPVRRLAVSEEERKRLIEELEKKHAGQPGPKLDLPSVAPVTVELPEQNPEESLWRSRARGHEEAIRRAQEELELLEARAAGLQAEINTFFAIGFNPRQFTYQTSQLARTREQIPYARLEVTRAERAWQQFKEEARRAGVMPGWLR